MTGRPVADHSPPAFEGHHPRECTEHRTAGPHRAWCFDCTEWCYPGEGCKGCRLGSEAMIPATWWQALKDYLTETRADAAELARANQFDLTIGAAFEAQVEILACTQAKMDELEQS